MGKTAEEKLQNLILKFRKSHSDYEHYDFSETIYEKVNIPIKVFCNKKDNNGNEHGYFSILPGNLISQKNVCPLCYKENCSKRETLTTENFIDNLYKLYKNTIKYDDINYKHNKIPVKIYCKCKDKNGKEHGYYEAKPCNLMRGIKGCPICLKEEKEEKHENYFFNLKDLYKFKPYDFSDCKYVNSSTKIKIYCKNTNKYGEEHGYFLIKPTDLKSGAGCPKCAGNYHKTTEEFIKDAKKIHGDKYDYSKVEYKNCDTKVCIICPEHGEFWQTPNKHLSGHGCPLCKESKLETEIEILLKENNILYNRNKTFDWLGRQSLDFYLPEHNIGIECQGEQHFKEIKYFNNISLEKRIELDDNKFLKCKEHNINILYYTTLNIPREFQEKYTYFKEKNKLIKEIFSRD